MSDPFDPYHKWLGIPPREQPANAYRLLGVELWEEDADVLENAADQRLRHLRAFQSGPHSADSQRIMNEVTAAKLCLIDSQAKAVYDAQLRASLVAPPFPEPPVANVASPPLETRSPSTRAAERGRQQHKSLPLEIAKHVLGAIVGLGLGYIILGFLRPSWDGLGIAKNVRAALNGSTSTVDPDESSRPNTPPKVKAPPPDSKPIAPPESVPAEPAGNGLPLPMPRSPHGKQPLPETAALASARETLLPGLGHDAAKLRLRAKESRPAAERYTLWMAAIDKAVADGDAALAIACAEELQHAFEIDGAKFMLATLTRLKETVVTQEHARALAKAAIAQFEESYQIRRTDDLPALAAIALAAARTSNDAELQRLATLKVIEAKQAPPEATDVPKDDILHVFAEHSAAAISPDDRHLITADKQGVLHLWKLPALRDIRQFKGHASPVSVASFTADGSRLLTIDIDKKAKLWDVETGAVLRAFDVQERADYLWLSPDGKRCEILNGHVYTYDVELGKLIGEIDARGGEKDVHPKGASADGRWIVVSGHTNTVRVVDLLSDARITLDGRAHCYGNGISWDGKFALTAGGDNIVRLWNVASKSTVAEYSGAEGHLYCVAMTPDGTRIVAGGADKCVHVWDTQSGERLQTYRCGAVMDNLKISASGRYTTLAVSQGAWLLRLP